MSVLGCRPPQDPLSSAGSRRDSPSLPDAGKTFPLYPKDGGSAAEGPLSPFGMRCWESLKWEEHTAHGPSPTGACTLGYTPVRPGLPLSGPPLCLAGGRQGGSLGRVVFCLFLIPIHSSVSPPPLRLGSWWPPGSSVTLVSYLPEEEAGGRQLLCCGSWRDPHSPRPSPEPQFPPHRTFPAPASGVGTGNAGSSVPTVLRPRSARASCRDPPGGPGQASPRPLSPGGFHLVSYVPHS